MHPKYGAPHCAFGGQWAQFYLDSHWLRCLDTMHASSPSWPPSTSSPSARCTPCTTPCGSAASLGVRNISLRPLRQGPLITHLCEYPEDPLISVQAASPTSLLPHADKLLAWIGVHLRATLTQKSSNTPLAQDSTTFLPSLVVSWLPKISFFSATVLAVESLVLLQLGPLPPDLSMLLLGSGHGFVIKF